jgi:hypothetical protein
MRRIVLLMIAAPLLGACADNLAPPVEQQPAPTSAVRETLVTRTAMVQDVDYETRQVLLRGDQGGLLELVAGPEVRNLGQLAPGDTVRLEYYEGVALQMAAPGMPGDAVGAAAVDRAPLGSTPGAGVAAIVDMIVDFIAYDPATAVATFRTPDGSIRQVVVHPEMRAFAESRAPGDRVEVTMAQAVATTVEKVGGLRLTRPAISEAGGRGSGEVL